MLTLILITTNGWNKRRYSTKKIHIWNRVRLTLRVKKIILNQILFSKLWYIGQIYTMPKYVKKGIGKGKICTISSGTGKIQPLRPPTQLSIWRDGISSLNIDTQLNYIKIKWIQRLLNPTNALWKDLMLYWLNLILKSDQDQGRFR